MTTPTTRTDNALLLEREHGLLIDISNHIAGLGRLYIALRSASGGELGTIAACSPLVSDLRISILDLGNSAMLWSWADGGISIELKGRDEIEAIRTRWPQIKVFEGDQP